MRFSQIRTRESNTICLAVKDQEVVVPDLKDSIPISTSIPFLGEEKKGETMGAGSTGDSDLHLMTCLVVSMMVLMMILAMTMKMVMHKNPLCSETCLGTCLRTSTSINKRFPFMDLVSPVWFASTIACVVAYNCSVCVCVCVCVTPCPSASWSLHVRILLTSCSMAAVVPTLAAT